MVTYTPRHEDITGADLTGSSGDLNRTYTLTNDNSVLAQMQLILAENVLMNVVNFTFDSDTGIITFLGQVFDDQNISIDYLTTEAIIPAGTGYSNTLQVVRYAGIGIEVFSEQLTANSGSTTSFDLSNGNVIANSYSLKFAASGSNDFTNLSETTHYTILKDQGLVELTAAGLALLDDNVLFIDYVYSPKQSDTVLTTYLAPAMAETDIITGNYWGVAKSSVQYFDGYQSGYPQTDEPYGTQIEPYPEFDIKYKGVNSITSVIFLDRQGDTDRTLDSTEYRIFTDDDYQESRLLINTSIPNGKANIQVTFVHGYTAVPNLVQELSAYIAGMMALTNISGGSYKDVSTYTLGRKTFSIGQVYVNIRESIDQMKSRIDAITTELGGNFDCA